VPPRPVPAIPVPPRPVPAIYGAGLVAAVTVAHLVRNRTRVA
jgi:hypothetical protein